MTDVFTADPSSNPVETLVGEGKKFKTVEDLAKGKLESDAFIVRLEREKAEMRAELDRKIQGEASLEQLKQELAELRAQSTRQPPRDDTRPALTEADVRALIARTITEDDTRRTVSQNIERANAAVIDHYGSVDKASEAVKAKARELNVSIDFLKEMAAKSPTAFVKLVADKAIEPSNALNITSTVNTNVDLTPSNAKEGTKEYFDEMLIKKPRQYWSQTTQQKIWNAVKAGTYQV